MAGSDMTVTRTVLEAAAAGGDKPAVVDAGGRTLAYSELATVGRAATGLARHGIRRGDVAAVYVTGAGQLAVGVHAFCAAGAVPLLVPPNLTGVELGAVLADNQVRVLLTSPALATTALEAVERSFVRQVFSFGAVPGLTPYASLLTVDPLRMAFAGSGRGPALLVCAGVGRQVAVSNAERWARVRRLAAASRVCADDVVAMSWPPRLARAHTCVIDLVLSQGATAVAVSEPGPEALLRAVRDHGATAIALGAAELRTVVAQRRDLSAVRTAIATGPVPADLRAACVRQLRCSVTCA